MTRWAIRSGSKLFGALVGRGTDCRRRFTLNGVRVQIGCQQQRNHLHGGIKDFDKVVWKGRPLKAASGAALELTYLTRTEKKDIPAIFRYSYLYPYDNNELRLDYSATTDKDTILT